MEVNSFKRKAQHQTEDQLEKDDLDNEDETKSQSLENTFTQTMPICDNLSNKNDSSDLGTNEVLQATDDLKNNQTTVSDQ